MNSRLHVPNNITTKAKSSRSTDPTQGMFQSRPFVVQGKQGGKLQQPDFNTSLMRAERYGHYLGQIQAASVSVPTAVQLQSDGMIQQPSLTTSLRQTERYGHHLNKTDLANQSEQKAIQPKLENKPVQLAAYKKKTPKKKNKKLLYNRKYSIKPQGKSIPGGTKTNNAVRKYANTTTTKIPTTYKDTFTYQSDNGTKKTRTFLGKNPHMSNQKPSRTTDWDAGHIQGNQIGGSGTHTYNIFPQNPIANQQAGLNGRKFTDPNSHKWHNPKKHTPGIKNKGQLMAWREWEDKKKRKAIKYGGLDVSFQGYA